MTTLVLYAHPLEESYSAAVRDAVCEGLGHNGTEHTVVGLAQGEEPDLDSDSYDHLVAVCPTWWGGPPAVLLDWLQRTCSDHVDGEDAPTPSPLAEIRRITVVTTHGSSLLINSLQGQPGKQTWSRVIRPMCHRGAEFEWVALYKIDRSDAEERAAFLERVREHFTSAPASV